ncbi:MAG: hypothetical protein AVDCRST_MAG66-307 [uncultured Pseudonocardia sp.]|uniref:Uncharacterized protein n=1 Tax=uncultured Pseudonocardia sp. TaxID=211455 RepID=A0A6J4N663_9PSEU|nr:MAG: hypothetical protein AVDCRST_MAG66-307 [uncultured Pseudonocardia sp.]
MWAGADTPDVPAGLAVDHVVPNVLDERLRASMASLTDFVHQAYMVDSKGLGPLWEITDTPIWPTPAVVELAVERMVGGRRDIVPAPLVVVDVGGATTDVLYCAELGREGEGRVAPGESVARQVFTDLGVVSSLPALRRGLAVEPELSELTAAVAPQGARSLHQDLCSGAPDLLEPPVGFLARLFLALRRLTDGARPLIDAGRVAGFLITGGAWTGTTDTDIRRVIGVACGSSPGFGEEHVDRAYRLWTDGLLAVPRQAVPGS